MRFQLFLLLLLFNTVLCAQIYVVNSTDDVDDGVCDGIHCSLREAILAAETDGLTSIIKFNIPGSGIHTIVPAMPFPSVVNNNLFIIGESQPGGAGAIQINFNFINHNNRYFWKITGGSFRLSGIEFRNYLFADPAFHVLQFGDDISISTENCIITNCSFMSDTVLNTPAGAWINVYKAPGMIIKNNRFGTDHTRSVRHSIRNGIEVGSYQSIGKVVIDSNVFVNKRVAILAHGGDLVISNNIFGALDTISQVNLLDPGIAISSDIFANAEITGNYFIGYPVRAIEMKRGYIGLRISQNSFIDNKGPGVIYLEKNSTGSVYVMNNTAVLRKNDSGNAYYTFIEAYSNNRLYVENNDVSNYGTFLSVNNISNQSSLKHSGNSIRCHWNDAIVYNGYPAPVINHVGNNLVRGLGNPNDSIVVYSNDKANCTGAICEGGIELGRTMADSLGNWILNATFNRNVNLSAYQFSPNRVQLKYSSFSSCYDCKVPVKTIFNPILCDGKTVLFRGKVYSESSADDTILVKGDGVNSCDSVFYVHVMDHYSMYFNPVLCLGRTVLFHSKLYTETSPDDTIYIKGDGVNSCDSIFFVHVMNYYLTEITIPRCFPSTSESDTVILVGLNCDSVVIITYKEVGVGHFSQTICDKSSITIWGETFDKNRPSGVIRLANGAQAGCDSVLYVQLNYISIDTSVINFDKGLFALDTVSSYQWLDCSDSSNILQNATNRYYEPSKNGSYAVIIQKNGCIDTSSCYPFIGVSTKESHKQNGTHIFPNPVTDFLNIWTEYTSAELKIRIRDCRHRIIAVENYSNQSNITLEVKNLVAGIYLLEIFDGKNFQQTKFLKI
jgi:CSLREA domain-containing protein